jgi:hypothetical protein
LKQQKKARKVGRPKMAKGEAKGRIVPTRFTLEDMQAMNLAAAANSQSVSEWIRSVVRHSFRWVVECKNCGKEFAFRFVDSEHPREVVNNMPMVEPPKPPLRNMAEEKTCPRCKATAIYKRGDLIFKSN